MLDTFTVFMLSITILPAIGIYLILLKKFQFSDEKATMFAVLGPPIVIASFYLVTDTLEYGNSLFRGFPMLIVLGAFVSVGFLILLSSVGWAIAKFGILRVWK